MLLAIDLDEDLINVESIAIATMIFLQSSGVQSSKFDAPQTDCFTADNDASFS